MGADRRMGRNRGRCRSGRWPPNHLVYKIGPRADAGLVRPYSPRPFQSRPPLPTYVHIIRARPRAVCEAQEWGR
jgi:hypothetical protein